MVKLTTRELSGSRPTLNRGAAVCHDTETNSIYYYGGIPWEDSDEDENTFNASRKPSVHLFKLDVRCQKWTHLTPDGEVYLEPQFIFPFIPTEEQPQEPEDPAFCENTQPMPLPALSDAIATFYRDPETCRSYILVFGGRQGRDAAKGVAHVPTGSEQFICIDVSLRVDPLAKRRACLYWRYIELDGWNTVRHRFGATGTIVENEDSILFCIFGGYCIPKGESRSCPATTYAIADLKSYSWVVSDYLLPDEMKPLGYRPHVIRLHDIPSKENVLLLSGWESLDSGFTVKLSTCLFDPFKNASEAFSSGKGVNLPSLPRMGKSFLSNFLVLQDRSSITQPNVMMAMLVGWQLEKLDTIRQHKTHELSLMNVKAKIFDSADSDTNLASDSHLTNADDIYEVGSSTSSDATAVDLRFNPKSTDVSNVEPLVGFEWSRTLLDTDNLSTFSNFGTDFTADFAVTNSGLHGVSVCIFGYKGLHAWSPAVTVNTVVEIYITTNELTESFETDEYDSDEESASSAASSASESDSNDGRNSPYEEPSTNDLRTLNADYLASMSIAESDDTPWDYTDYDPNTHDALQHDLVDALLNG